MLLHEFWIVYFPITGCQLYIDLAYGFTTYRTTDGSTILSSELLMESTRFKFQSHFMGEHDGEQGVTGDVEQDPKPHVCRADTVDRTAPRWRNWT